MATCNRCRGSLVSITLSVGGGVRTLHSCSACDHRVWTDETAERLDLSDLLTDLADDVARQRAEQALARGRA